ncbi:putative acyltransferase [Acidovorax sp. CF316]|uniref:LpxL/LpxP family acyltransferase n=1 Tax=Acidovorax sp. CF316 TaxID=1144317 RepID=UPI00026BCF91|nr:acyltransferase [Acidovorax sp. CF316]EJE52275.1 putative acyltransferase [Acidovorax sp. CF316]
MTAPTPAPGPQAAPPPAAPHWAQLGENTFVAGMWLMVQVHRFLGRWPFLLCLYPIVAYYWLASPVARRASLQYLQRMQAAHGLWPRMPGWRQSQRHFRMFAQVILDKLLALSGRYRFDRVAFTGREPLNALLAQGQGAVVVTAHMGCIELCRAVAERRSGLRLSILVHTAHAERFNRVLQRLAPDSGVQLLQVTEFNAATAMMLAERVARGELIAIAGDRVPVRESRVTHAPFLGHQAPFPCGPYILASVLECPLYFMGCVHEGAGYAVEFVPLAERVLLPRARREQALAEYAALFAQQLERMLRKAPYDWFNFFPFWEQGAPARPAHAAHTA